MALSDRDYKANDVLPPVRYEHEVVDTEDHPLSDFINNNQQRHKHEWHLEGNDLYCDAGEARHGRLIAPTMILKGTDGHGDPIFETIDLDILRA